MYSHTIEHIQKCIPDKIPAVGTTFDFYNWGDYYLNTRIKTSNLTRTCRLWLLEIESFCSQL